MRGLSLYNNKNFIQVLNSSSLRHKCFTNWNTLYEIKVCRLQTRDQRNGRSGEWGEQENPKIFPPHPHHPFFPYQRAGSNAKWIMLHAFLSASLQDNLWNSEQKTIKAFKHVPVWPANKHSVIQALTVNGFQPTKSTFILKHDIKTHTCP